MTAVPKAKLFPVSTQVNDRDHLVIGGCDLVDLTAEFGTPLYVFDEATLRAQAEGFGEAFRSRYPDTKLLYACKACLPFLLETTSFQSSGNSAPKPKKLSPF